MKLTAIGSVIPGLAAACYAAILLADPSSSFNFQQLKGRPNLDQTPLGNSAKWSLEKLLALTQREGVKLWSGLPAVPIKEMNGHYLGLIPCADNIEQQRKYAKLFLNENSGIGYWLGNGFRPTGDTTGEGYNRFRLRGGTIVRNYRMKTRIGPSSIDGKPSFIVDYSEFHKEPPTREELRKLDDSSYLGVSRNPTAKGKRDELFFWVLVGPTDEWVGPNQE